KLRRLVHTVIQTFWYRSSASVAPSAKERTTPYTRLPCSRTSVSKYARSEPCSRERSILSPTALGGARAFRRSAARPEPQEQDARQEQRQHRRQEARALRIASDPGARHADQHEEAPTDGQTEGPASRRSQAAVQMVRRGRERLAEENIQEPEAGHRRGSPHAEQQPVRRNLTRSFDGQTVLFGRVLQDVGTLSQQADRRGYAERPLDRRSGSLNGHVLEHRRSPRSDQVGAYTHGQGRDQDGPAVGGGSSEA